MNPMADPRTGELLEKKLKDDGSLSRCGFIFTDPKGELKDVIKDIYHAEGRKVSGYLRYAFDSDGRLTLAMIKNIPVKEACSTVPSVDYVDKQAKHKGRESLYTAFMRIAEIVGAKELDVHTWMIPARPWFLTDRGNFFYGWNPVSDDQHERAVRHFKKNPVHSGNMSQYHMGKGDMAQYFKRLR